MFQVLGFGKHNVLTSRDGNENLFSFLLPSSASGNKKEKNCSGQRDK
jgi:hypothetical protein